MVCAVSGSLLIANPAICLQKTDRGVSVSITDAKIVFYFETIF
mgnify:CR=1 FL=1